MIAWIDKNRKEYKLNEITNKYLLNILSFVYLGGGWNSFVSLETMERLYDESVKRKLNYPIGKYKYMKNIEEREEDIRQLQIENELKDFDWMNGTF